MAFESTSFVVAAIQHLSKAKGKNWLPTDQVFEKAVQESLKAAVRFAGYSALTEQTDKSIFDAVVEELKTGKLGETPFLKLLVGSDKLWLKAYIAEAKKMEFTRGEPLPFDSIEWTRSFEKEGLKQQQTIFMQWFSKWLEPIVQRHGNPPEAFVRSLSEGFPIGSRFSEWKWQRERIDLHSVFHRFLAERFRQDPQLFREGAANALDELRIGLRALDADTDTLAAKIDQVIDSLPGAEALSERLAASVDTQTRLLTEMKEVIYELPGEVERAIERVLEKRIPLREAHRESTATKLPAGSARQIRPDTPPTRKEKINACKGLATYTETDADTFFGRDLWLYDAIDRFSALWHGDGRLPFFGIFGGSGVGKSSLLRAGLLPRLGDVEYRSVTLSPNDLLSDDLSGQTKRNGKDFALTPLGRLAILAAGRIEPNRPSADIASKATKVVRAQPEWVVRELIRLLEADPSRSHGEPQTRRLIIALDQFEELLDFSYSEEGRSHLALLFEFLSLACRTNRIGVAYTCQLNRREQLEGDSLLSKLAEAGDRKEVTFLGEENIKEIAIKTLELSGFDLSYHVQTLYDNVVAFADRMEESKSPDEKLKDSQASLLPHFSLTLLYIHQHCSENRDKLRRADAKRDANSPNGLIKVGKKDLPAELLQVETAISRLADKAIEKAKEYPGVNWSDDVLKNLLRRLVRILDPKQDRFSLPAIAAPKSGPGKILVEILAQHRLLIPIKSDRYRLAHESIVISWKPAQTWLSEERTLLAYEQELLPVAEFWDTQLRCPNLVAAMTAATPGRLDKLASLLKDWFASFHPRDGTQPSESDRKLCDFALAALSSSQEPSHRIKTEEGESSLFLIALNYGQRTVVERFLEIEPDAAATHLTSKNSNAAYSAVFSKDPLLLDLVVANGANPNVANANGWHPIHVSTDLGDIEMLKRLLHFEASSDQPGGGGQTPLHLAAANDDLPTLRWLFENSVPDPNAKNEKQWNMLHTATRLASTATVAWILKETQIDVSAAADRDWTPLHFACRYGDREMVALLLDHPSSDPTCLTKHGWTPLHLAIYNKSEGVVEALLQEERIDRTEATPGKNRRTIIELAINDGSMATLVALLNDPLGKVDPDATIGAGDTPLAKACTDGKLEVARHLVDAGARVNGDKKEKRSSPFLRAATAGACDILELLLPKADLSERDKEDRNALHLAAQGGHAQAVALLAAHIDLAITDLHGFLPIHLAVKAGSLRSVQAITRQAPQQVNAPDGLGRGAIHLAASEGRLEIVSNLSNKAVDALDADGATALHHAAKHSHAKVVRHLLERVDANPNAEDKHGWTPLHFAAQSGNEECVQLLLEHGANKKATSSKLSRSPLQLAAAVGRCDLVPLLLSEQSTPQDNDLQAALELSVRNAQFDCASLLLDLIETKK